MIDERFIFLGVILGSVGTVIYLIDTIKGKVKPNRVTWFLWALAPLIAFASQIKQGVGIQALVTFVAGFGPLCIFLASFLNKDSYWKISKFDIICGILSILGLAMWYFTRIDNLAILFGIIADAFAAAPTLVKAWKAPDTENYKAFILSALASGVALLVISVWDFAHYAFPLYIVSICIMFVVIIKFRLGERFGNLKPVKVVE